MTTQPALVLDDPGPAATVSTATSAPVSDGRRSDVAATAVTPTPALDALEPEPPSTAAAPASALDDHGLDLPIPAATPTSVLDNPGLDMPATAATPTLALDGFGPEVPTAAATPASVLDDPGPAATASTRDHAPEGASSLAPPRAAPEEATDLALVLASAILTERGAPTAWRSAPIRQGLASAVIDAVMTPRITTPSVDATVHRYETRFGVGEAEALISSFDELGPDRWRQEIATNHRTFSRADAPYKADAILDAARLLHALGVDDVGQLWARADDEALRAAWCGLPGQSSGATWRHLLLVSGYTEMLVCPLTRRFARRSLPRSVADSPALVSVIDDAADVLDVTAFDAEHQMWRAAASPHRRSLQGS